MHDVMCIITDACGCRRMKRKPREADPSLSIFDSIYLSWSYKEFLLSFFFFFYSYDLISEQSGERIEYSQSSTIYLILLCLSR